MEAFQRDDGFWCCRGKANFVVSKAITDDWRVKRCQEHIFIQGVEILYSLNIDLQGTLTEVMPCQGRQHCLRVQTGVC